MNTKEFPTRDVLSTVTGRLMGEIGGVYEVLNWMTDESLFTHQLPRVSREARPVMLAFMPELAGVIEEAEDVTQENYLQYRDSWEKRFGLTLAVPKMTIADHERIDPLSELAEKVSPDKIIAVAIK